MLNKALGIIRAVNTSLQQWTPLLIALNIVVTILIIIMIYPLLDAVENAEYSASEANDYCSSAQESCENAASASEDALNEIRY